MRHTHTNDNTNGSSRGSRRGRSNKGGDNGGNKSDGHSKHGSYQMSKAGKKLAQTWNNPIALTASLRAEIADRVNAPIESGKKLVLYSQQIPVVRNARSRSFSSPTASQPFNFAVTLMTMLGLTLKSFVDKKTIVNLIVTIVRTLAIALNQPFNEVQVKRAVQIRMIGVDFTTVSIADLIQSFGVRDITTITYGGLYGIMIKWLENSPAGMVLTVDNTVTGVRYYAFDANVVGDQDSDAFYTAMPEYVMLFDHNPAIDALEFIAMETPDMPKNFLGTTIARHDDDAKGTLMSAELIRNGKAPATPFNLDTSSAKKLVSNGDLSAAKWTRTIATIDGLAPVVEQIDSAVTKIEREVKSFRQIVRKDYSGKPSAKRSTSASTRTPALAGATSGFQS